MAGKNVQVIKKGIELLKEPMLAFLAAFLIACFAVGLAKVPTESMAPTINPGDHLVVNYLPYYYRNPYYGELVVFKQNEDCLIKRVIGLPGDIIEIIDDTVYRNHEPLDESDYLNAQMKTYIFAGSDITFPYTVPEACYFVMGDNRENSSDSRFFGPISRKQIIAKASYRVFPFNNFGIIE